MPGFTYIAVALDGIRTKAMTAICILMAGFF
jgi:hypothetical protein